VERSPKLGYGKGLELMKIDPDPEDPANDTLQSIAQDAWHQDEHDRLLDMDKKDEARR
jgi:hypothetical protein